MLLNILFAQQRQGKVLHYKILKFFIENIPTLETLSSTPASQWRLETLEELLEVVGHVADDVEDDGGDEGGQHDAQQLPLDHNVCL